MEEKHTKILNLHIVEITRVLDPEKVLSYFIQEDVLDEEDIAEMKAQTTRHKMVEKFLDVLKRSNVRAFDVFIEALEKKQEHLACLLLRSELERVKGPLHNSKSNVLRSIMKTELSKKKKENATTRTKRGKFKRQLQPGGSNENQATSSRPQNSVRAREELESETRGKESKTESLAEMNDLVKRLEGLLNKACTELLNTSGQIKDKATQLEDTLSRLSRTTESFQARVSSSREQRHRVTEEDRSHQQNKAEEQEAEPLGAMDFKNEIQRKCKELRQSNNESKDHVKKINDVKQNLLREIKEAGERLSQDEANELNAQLRGIITLREKIDELEKDAEAHKSEKENVQAKDEYVTRKEMDEK